MRDFFASTKVWNAFAGTLSVLAVVAFGGWLGVESTVVITAIAAVSAIWGVGIHSRGKISMARLAAFPPPLPPPPEVK